MMTAGYPATSASAATMGKVLTMSIGIDAGGTAWAVASPCCCPSVDSMLERNRVRQLGRQSAIGSRSPRLPDSFESLRAAQGKATARLPQIAPFIKEIWGDAALAAP